MSIHTPDLIAELLGSRLGARALVYTGWPNQKHVEDLRRKRGLSGKMETPEVSISAYDNWPNHLDINVWARSASERDAVSQLVANILSQIKEDDKIGIIEINIQDITFEEKGIIRPGNWDTIKGSNPVFRKLLQVKLSPIDL